VEKSQFICFIEPVRAEMPDAPTPEESEIVAAHFRHLQKARAEGRLILAGRTLTPPFVGISIFEAETELEARSFVELDPAVEAGVFRVRAIQPYRVALERQV
jgi:uncharacterized protein YciI